MLSHLPTWFMVCTKIHVNNGWNQDWQKTTPAHQVFSKFCPSPMLGLKLHMVRIQRASNQKCLPSRELTCPPTVCHFLKIIFLFPRWDMLVFWRVGVYSKEFLTTSNHQSFIFQWWNGERKKHQSYTHHMKGDLYDCMTPINKTSGDLLAQIRHTSLLTRRNKYGPVLGSHVTHNRNVL